MRSFQNFLLVVGATALGVCLAFLALYWFTEATGFLKHHGPSDLGAAGLGVIVAIGTGVLGTIAGLAGGIWWITKRDRGLWPRRIWIGAALGAATGVLFHLAATHWPVVPNV